MCARCYCDCCCGRCLRLFSCDSDDGATRAAAVLGLVESAIWALLSLLALLYSVCAIAPRADTLLYLIYFYDESCGAQTPSFMEILSPGWPPDGQLLPPAARTRTIASVRFTFSLCRIGLSSALLFVRHKQRHEAFRLGRPPRPYFPVYFAWLMGCMADLLMDVVIAALYALDFSRTNSVRGVMVLLGVDVPAGSSWESLLPAWARSSPGAPTALLLVVASRLFPLLWAADVVAFVLVTGAARRFQQRFRHFRTDDSTTPSQEIAGVIQEPKACCSYSQDSEQE